MRKQIHSLNEYGAGLPEWRAFFTASAGDNRRKMMSMKKSLRSAILHELTDCQREVLQMRYYENKSINEIARHLQINKSSVSRRIQRAQYKLHRVLLYGYFPDGDDTDSENILQ